MVKLNLEQKRKQLATFAKDAAQHFGNGENHLSMRDLMTYRTRDPFTGGSHASLMASGTEVAGFAGEGEEASDASALLAEMI